MLVIVATFFMAGLVKGVTGMGLPTLSMGVLGAFMSPVIAAHLEGILSPIIGAITGIISGSTGVFVIPAVPYLQALGLQKDDLIQALGLSFTISTISLAAGLTMGGQFNAGDLTLSTLAIIPALLGMKVGTLIRARISILTFRRWFLIF